MKSMINDKSPGNDELTKEFNKTICDEIIDLFYKSVTAAKTKMELNISQKQTVTKIIEKRTGINDI